VTTAIVMVRRAAKEIAVGFVMLVVGGCAGRIDDSPANTELQSDGARTLSAMQHDSALVGGLQPRIREYIHARYQDGKERIAMERIAVAQQQALIRGTQSRADAKVVALEYSQALTCMRFLRGVDNRVANRDHVAQYNAIVTVTRESKDVLARLLVDEATLTAYANFVRNLGGQVFEGGTVDVCSS
jgi:hypothetical protein